MHHLGLFRNVNDGGGDWEQLLDPGLDGDGLRTDRSELKIIAGFFPIMGLVCSFVLFGTRLLITCTLVSGKGDTRPSSLNSGGS